MQYLDADGKLITESLKDYTRKTVRKAYASLDAFLNAWNDADRKQAIIEELASQGVFLDELAEQVGRDFDAFDLICHVAFDQPPLTRRERAEKVRKRNVFAKYGDKARAVLEALLDKYADAGLTSVESLEILKVDPLTTFGTPVEIVNLFGGKQHYLAAIHELENAALPGSSLIHVPMSPTSSNPSRTSCARTPAPTAMPSGSNSSAGCSSSRSSTTARRSSNSCATTTSRRCRSTCAGGLGRRRRGDHRRSAARLRQQHPAAQAQGADGRQRTRSPV